MSLKKGDRVRFLNAVGGGVVVRVDSRMAYVEDADGFETPVLISECVVVGHDDMSRATVPAPKAADKPAQGKPKVDLMPAAPEIPFVETPEGELLNVKLIFEPQNLRSLSTTAFYALLVNDSNYTLSYAWLTRPDESQLWTCRSCGTIDPGYQQLLGEITRDDLPEMDRIALQFIAYKPTRDFQLKAPVLVEKALDTTKFAKLHAFKPSAYSDVPVISIDIVTNDVTAERHRAIDPDELKRAMLQKERPNQPRRQSAPARKQGDEIVVDLHIGELIDTTAGLNNADMLELQLRKFREVMDENLSHPGTRLIFIHGKGNGVLRAAIAKELAYRYKEHDVQDASFSRYGFGATQVTIRQKR